MTKLEARKKLDMNFPAIVAMVDKNKNISYVPSERNNPPIGFYSWVFTLNDFRYVLKLKDNIEISDFHKPIWGECVYSFNSDSKELTQDEIHAFLKEYQGCWFNIDRDDMNVPEKFLKIYECFSDRTIYINIPRNIIELYALD